MADEWRTVRFSEVCNIWRGGSPRPIHEWIVPQGIPWVKISDATSAGSRYIEQTKEFIRPEGRTRSREVVPGDLILSNSATPGLPMFMAMNACIHDGWLLLRNFEGIDKLFCYYLLLYERPNIVRQGTGSVFTNLKTDILKNHVVRIPPIKEQQAIACILGTLDDKIELNRRMNQTLEAMVQAIFKSWFVDFHPVRAKANAEEPPGLAPHIAYLFPDGFEESELGEIPKGWRVTSIGEHASVVKGLSYKGKHLCDAGDGLPLHNLNSVYEGGGYKYEGIKWYNGEYRDRHVLAPGDVIVTNTEQGFEHLLIGYAAIVPRCFGHKGLYTHHIYRLRPRKESYLPPWFFYLLLRSPRFHGTVAGYSNGTTVNMLPADGLEKPQFVLPPRELLERFGPLITSVLRRKENLHDESLALTELRDTLLPKLISGELRVPDAERIVERFS